MQTQDGAYVTMDQLRVGLYVYIDLKWFEHPFAFNNFKIKDDDQIATIRGLGLKRVRFDAARSESKPKPREAEKAADAATSEETVPKEHPALAAKRALIEKIKVQREAAERIEHAFVDTAKTIRDVEKNLLIDPEKTVAQASKLVGQIADSILSAPELAIHVMGDKIGGEELYFHSLNVTMLSLMVAREIRLPQDAVQPLGMGALFHDVGRRQIPDKILMKMEPLTQAEKNLYELHCQYGVEIGQKLHFVPAALAVIGEHHELFDGSGYPQGLTGEAIPLEGRIVAIADVFDALVSVRPYKPALPLETALQYFDEQSGRHFDPTLLVAFKKALPEILRIKEIYADENGALTDLEFHIKEIYDHKDDPTGYPEILSSTEGGLD